MTTNAGDPRNDLTCGQNTMHVLPLGDLVAVIQRLSLVCWRLS
ncbi:Uncharacterised protein [Mycobacterium tuberculosis]|nr:Uncharacterised protein [Mycobacterium tuberculosis]